MISKPLPSVEEIRALLHIGESIPVVITNEDRKLLHDIARVSWDEGMREESVSY